MPDQTIPAREQPITKKLRLPRYERAKNPPRMVLTDRDKEILRQVYLFRLMTREQIERLLFADSNGKDHLTKTSLCRKRLKFLYHHGYLERMPTPISPGVWAWRPVYRLAPKGAEVVASLLEVSIKELPYWGRGFDKDHRQSDASLLFLEHTLAINDFRLAVLSAAKDGGYRLQEWIDDTQLKSKAMKDYVQVSSGETRNVKMAVVPDAYFILNLGDRRAHFFLELDRGTMSNQRWKMRVRAYKTYIERGKYQERYHTNSLRILTVTTGDSRRDNLRKTTEQAGGSSLFWFTTLGEITPQSVLAWPIWAVAQETQPAILIS